MYAGHRTMTCYSCYLTGHVSRRGPLVHIEGSMQKRRNANALAMELRLFCIKPSIHLVDVASDIMAIHHVM